MKVIPVLYNLHKIGHAQSNPQIITYGAPQGSIAFPNTFNSIPEIGLEGDVTLYVNDTSLFYLKKSLESISFNVQHDLKVLNAWFQTNLLTIDILKLSTYILFSAKNKRIS